MTLVNLGLAGVGIQPLLTIPQERYARYRGTPGTLSADAVVTLKSYAVTAELPLETNASFEHGERRGWVVFVGSGSGQCTVGVRESRLNLLLAPPPRPLGRFMFVMVFDPDVLYLLRNRPRAEALWPGFGASFGFTSPVGGRLEETTFFISYSSEASMHPPAVRVPGRPPPPELSSDWLAGADLVRLEAREVASFQTKVTVERFLMDPGGERAVEVTPPRLPSAGRRDARAGGVELGRMAQGR